MIHRQWCPPCSNCSISKQQGPASQRHCSIPRQVLVNWTLKSSPCSSSSRNSRRMGIRQQHANFSSLAGRPVPKDDLRHWKKWYVGRNR